MNLMGKILTFLILIMSLVFMTFTLATYATHKNWRDQATKLGQEKQTLQSTLSANNEKLAAVTSKLEGERASRRAALASKETSNKLMAADLKTLNTKYGLLETQHRKLVATVNQAQAEVAKATKEVNTMRVAFQKMHTDRNGQLAAATQARDALAQASSRLATTQRTISNLNDTLADTKLELDGAQTGIGGGKIAGRTAMELDGRVEGVRDNMVVVSLGSDEGLREGDKLDVWRGNGSYIGRIKVVETRTDTAAAVIVREYLQGTIQQGDNVATKLL